MDMDRLISMIEAFYPYARKAMEFNRPVDIELHSDPENADADFGKTAAYSPSEHKVILYVDNRHHKDILRSLSHELVHHLQNCRGEFDREFETGPGYAQEDGHLRKMEEEAYLLGNLCLRDYEDGIKSKGLFEKLLKEWCN